MADIFMSVPKVPWHCEHRVDKAKCAKCRDAEIRRLVTEVNEKQRKIREAQ